MTRDFPDIKGLSPWAFHFKLHGDLSLRKMCKFTKCPSPLPHQFRQFLIISLLWSVPCLMFHLRIHAALSSVSTVLRTVMCCNNAFAFQSFTWVIVWTLNNVKRWLCMHAQDKSRHVWKCVDVCVCVLVLLLLCGPTPDGLSLLKRYCLLNFRVKSWS